MSRTNAFIDGEPDKGGGGEDEKKGDDLGFPANTPWREMKPEEQTAYWRHQARKHEGVADSRKDYDQLKADSDELAQLKKDRQTQAEKDLEEAREQGRRDGENLGAEKYLGDAVKANFRVLTGKSVEDVDTAFAHIDAHSFIGKDGAIDHDALTEFAKTFGTSGDGDGNNNPSGKQTDPVREALERHAGGGNGGGDGSGSIQAIREATREKLAPTKK